MNRSFNSRDWVLFLVVLLTLGLVACERPLQEESVERIDDAYPAKTDGSGIQTGSQREPFLPLVTGLSGAEAYPSPFGGQQVGQGDALEAAPAVPQPDPLIYEVRSGDTLMSIAIQYDVTVEEIASASGLSNVDVLEVGQRLVIPVDPAAVEAAAAETPEEAPLETQEQAPVVEQPSVLEQADQVHIVQSGENLYRIGLLYGCTHQELADYNKMANPDYVDVGDEIRIPSNCE